MFKPLIKTSSFIIYSILFSLILIVSLLFLIVSLLILIFSFLVLIILYSVFNKNLIKVDGILITGVLLFQLKNLYGMLSIVDVKPTTYPPLLLISMPLPRNFVFVNNAVSIKTGRSHYLSYN